MPFACGRARIDKVEVLFLQTERRVRSYYYLFIINDYIDIILLFLSWRRALAPLHHWVESWGTGHRKKTALSLMTLGDQMIADVRPGVVGQRHA